MIECVNMNIWQKIVKKKRPFFVLAPMADVTDSPFRQIISACGTPDLFYTEFISADGLASAGYDRLIRHLKFSKKEKPIIAQFFSSNPENIYKAAKLAVKLGFDGVDINMGCPDKKIIKSGGGAALIKNFELAKEIILATKRGAGKLPVSVKTRIGYSQIITEAWIGNIIKARPDAIIVHGRTMKEMSKVSCHWDEIAKAAKLIKKAGIVAIGNGDVLSIDEGTEKAKKYSLDGIMIGRGIFQNPWVFNKKIDPNDIKPKDRIGLALRHIKLFKKFWGNDRNYDNLKKFYKIYISGWPGAKELRTRLMNTKNLAEAIKVTKPSHIESSSLGD